MAGSRKPTEPQLTGKQEYILFLKGALSTADRIYAPPANRVALRHFLEGVHAVDSGYVKITDPAAMHAFVRNVETASRIGGR